MNYHPRQIGNKTERYALIQEGKRDIFIIGLNPSTADETKPDPTMRRTMQIAEFNGYDGFIMLNLYPQRSTKPKDLARNIAKQIESDLRYPGRIKITMIRETRIIEYAR